ncbi:MAG: 50S ribosomal protein L37ae [Candidatus Aenigmatarchaeota archaeon]
MGRKKEVGTTGRFGPKYGKRIRLKLGEIEKIQKKRHVCPKCNLPYVKRVAAGIWKCKKCGVKFAGPAYYPKIEIVKKEE